MRSSCMYRRCDKRLRVNAQELEHLPVTNRSGPGTQDETMVSAARAWVLRERGRSARWMLASRSMVATITLAE